MAKELPYFKFEPAEYLTKDISFCSIGSQGLFINICSYYWQRECSLTVEQVSRRFNYPNELQELIDEGIIDIENSVIKIKFLDLQYEDATKLSSKNSLNGSKGGRPKKNPTETETKPKLNPTESQTKGIREDKRIEDDIDIRKQKFTESLRPFLITYGTDMLNDFYLYWTEHGYNDIKMRFEKEKTFGLKQRLERWSKNNFSKPQKDETTDGYMSHVMKQVNQIKQMQ
jgi:hypothetical protein